jgi:hypothetical protein
MDAYQSQKIRVDNHDYISNLPADVQEKILVKLPIKEMARTSILSRKWINSWTSIPDMAFEENCTESELIRLVDMVLLAHRGSIRKFKFVSDHACNEGIGRWLPILCRNGIKELDLVFNNERCNIPFGLISSVVLERVYLFGCNIDVPPFFQGFKLVRALMLAGSELSGISIENMVSSCPLLDHLVLASFVQQGCLRIIAPNLTTLNIIGDFHDVCLETPKLVCGYIDLITTNRDYQTFSVATDGTESNIIRALGHLSNIQKLVICGEFCDVSSIRIYLKKNDISKPILCNTSTNRTLHPLLYFLWH